MTPEEIAARIATIRETLATGATSINVDGTSVTIDHDSLRRELRQLMAEDAVLRHRKPRFASFNLGNA